MRTLTVAFRNVFRNARRSLTTTVAIAVGAIAVVLFGGYVSAIVYGLQTGMVQGTGHLHVYRSGYFLYGSGNPSAYGIPGYRDVMRAILEDAELKPLVRVATPRMMLFGIAGNFADGASKTFMGVGVVPSDRNRMAGWNDYDIGISERRTALRDEEPEAGVVGAGLARILRLCGALNVPNCLEPPRAETAAVTADGKDLLDLAAGEAAGGAGKPVDGRPRVDLLSATASGAPNVVSMAVLKAEGQGVREFDDAYVGLHFDLAQRLVYGRDATQASAIVLQLNHTRDLPAVRKRLAALFAERGLDLETRDFAELMPTYGQITGMFNAIFGFIAVLMGVIVLFTVVNTMGMAVVERTQEIGTLRALGLRRGAVRRLFVAEGAILGVLGATLGVGLGVAIAMTINRAGMTWTPPNNVEPVPLLILVSKPALLAGTWAGLALLATLSALWPANRAARLVIVDALRHV